MNESFQDWSALNDNIFYFIVISTGRCNWWNLYTDQGTYCWLRFISVGKSFLPFTCRWEDLLLIINLFLPVLFGWARSVVLYVMINKLYLYLAYIDCLWQQHGAKRCVGRLAWICSWFQSFFRNSSLYATSNDKFPCDYHLIGDGGYPLWR